jgi:hypothetical protein
MCKQICQVKPYLFEDFLIISLDKKWISVLGGKIPEFTAMIDEKGRLSLVGPVVYKKKEIEKN